MSSRELVNEYYRKPIGECWFRDEVIEGDHLVVLNHHSGRQGVGLNTLEACLALDKQLNPERYS
jgi:hypothetical protein